MARSRREAPPKDPDAVKLGEQLRAARRRAGLSLLELEAASNGRFKQSAVGSYERGERAASGPRLAALFRYYGITPNEGFGTAPDTRELYLVVRVPPSSAGGFLDAVDGVARALGGTVRIGAPVLDAAAV